MELNCATLRQHDSTSEPEMCSPHRETLLRQAKHSPFEGTPRYNPTETEMTLIRRSWSTDFNDLYSLGIDIYAFIFEHAPEARFLFPEVVKAGSKWKDLACARSQSLKFVQVISETVMNLSRTAYLDSYLQHIGELHVRIAIDKGFHSDLWKVFKDAISSTMGDRIMSGKYDQRLPTCDREAALTAWTNLSVKIIQTMHAGYAAEIGHRFKH